MKKKNSYSKQIFTLNISKEKLIKILTPVFKKHKVLNKNLTITDFMIALNTSGQFESITAVILSK